MSRLARRPGSRGEPSVGATVLASLLIGLFIVLGVGSLLSTLTLLLPSYEEPVKLVGRDQYESSYVAPRSATARQLSYRTLVEYEDGTRRALSCREDLYRKSLAGLRGLDEVMLRSSVLAGRPLSVSITSKPLFTLPALRVEPTGKTEVFSLTMPRNGILISALFCWGIAIYLMVKLRKNPVLVPKVYFPMLVFFSFLGLVWWYYSV
jgi:hypothetical protein